MFFFCFYCFFETQCSSDCLAAVDAGIKAEPCSLCTWESGDTLFTPTAAFDSTAMPDSSYCYHCRKWRKQAVSMLLATVLFFIETLHLLNSVIQWWKLLVEHCCCDIVFMCSSEMRKIAHHIQTGILRHIYINFLVSIYCQCTVHHFTRKGREQTYGNNSVKSLLIFNCFHCLTRQKIYSDETI